MSLWTTPGTPVGQDNVRRTHDLQNNSKITKMAPLGMILVHSSSKISRMFAGSGWCQGGLVGLLVRMVEFGPGLSSQLGRLPQVRPLLLVVVWCRGG